MPAKIVWTLELPAMGRLHVVQGDAREDYPTTNALFFPWLGNVLIGRSFTGLAECKRFCLAHARGRLLVEKARVVQELADFDRALQYIEQLQEEN